MIDYATHTDPGSFTGTEKQEFIEFLAQHLEKYGDSKTDIGKAIDYASSLEGKPGGLLISARAKGVMVGAVVINRTGMEGYIPENILVYIATHGGYRGQGIGKKLMQLAIEYTQGDIALHVEPDNPAKKLYEKLGFSNKYLEMRLSKH